MAVIPDEKLKKNVVDHLYYDERVNASDVMVEVTNGIVQLGGTVPTYVAQTAAFENAAGVAGVVDVDNLLQVVRPSPADVPTDDDIRVKVEHVLAWAPDIDVQHIEIDVVDGVVLVKGSVDALYKSLRVEELISNIADIVDIDNQLTIVPSQDIADETIAVEIKSALRRRTDVYPDEVDVIVHNGRVTLSGRVPTRPAKQAVLDTARFTSGVREIADGLYVRPAQ